MTDTGGPGSPSAAFDLLHPSVQRQLWDMQWESLRPLQVSGIRAILTSSQHVILAAPTAAGKTEAAFLPILSAIADEAAGSVRAIYVGPLKALINDQFNRLGELCSHLELPVHSWHGDIAVHKKAKLIANPGGVLLITPESIESLFVNRGSHLARVFGGLRFIVIDELHTFLDNARGLHLRSLLTRLLAKTQNPSAVRLVGLSATIGDMAVAQGYLAPDAPETVSVVEDEGEGKELKLRVHCYLADPPNVDPDASEDPPEEAFEALVSDVIKHCQGHANLVFANSRADVELLGEACRVQGQRLKLPDQFLVHHGSLSADIRRDAEATMKAGAIATTFCTPTLELGVDIGSVRTVGQVDPPWSVASLKQRLGRSGRRAGEAQILRMYVREERVAPDGDLFDRLHLDLVRALATTELLLSGWIEPPQPPVCDLSTLVHQVVSAIGEVGGRAAADIYRLLCADGPFRDVDPLLFTRLLRQLGTREVIEQMPGGDLILGGLGERLYRHFTFYAVFQTPEAYTLIHESERLGTLDVVPEEGQHVIFAARRWLVLSVDPERREIHVRPARGRKRTAFGGRGGMIDTEIAAKMREILVGAYVPTYLDDAGCALLEQGRHAAMAAGVARRATLPLGPRRSCLLTWGGTRVHLTLAAMMKTLDLHPLDRLVGLDLPIPQDQVLAVLKALFEKQYDPEHLALAVQDELPGGKFDWILGPELLAVRQAKQSLDLPNAQACLQYILASS
jgi:ATP-dependent Lhr-like helicase